VFSNLISRSAKLAAALFKKSRAFFAAAITSSAFAHGRATGLLKRIRKLGC